MVLSIRPVVHRTRQQLKWLLMVLGFASSSTLGGAFAGGVISLIAIIGASALPLPRVMGVLCITVLCWLFVADSLGLAHMPYPQRISQVPQRWKATYHPAVWVCLYGIHLGMGVTTRIVSRSLYVVLVGLLVFAHPLFGALAFAMFGLGRGIALFAAGFRSHRIVNGDELEEAMCGIMAKQDMVYGVAALGLAVAAGYWSGVVAVGLHDAMVR